MTKDQSRHIRAAWLLSDLKKAAIGARVEAWRLVNNELDLLEWMMKHHRDLSGVSPPVRELPAGDTPPGMERGA